MILAQYNQVPKVTRENTRIEINSDGVTNPVDGSPYQLLNIRGDIVITLITSDNPDGVYASFNVKGGYGRNINDPTQNFYFVPSTNKYCIITQTIPNVINIETTAPNVVRNYTITFIPNIAFPPSIISTGTDLATNNLYVNMEKLNYI